MTSSLLSLMDIMLIICSQIIKVKSVDQYNQIRSGATFAWTNAPDVNVIEGPGVTAILNNWEIEVTSQEGADLTIELGSDTWGMIPDEISHYNFQFQGSTQTTDDAELLFAVSVGDYYFAQLISLDTTSQQYQQCPASNSPLLEGDMSTIIDASTPDRYNRFCDDSDWNDHGFGEAGIWPMGFFLYSDPSENTLQYSWYHDFINSDEIIDVSSSYTTTFPSNQGLKIYISGNKLGQSFTIERINLFYRTYPIPTSDPTPNPTYDPTTATPTSTAANQSPPPAEPMKLITTTEDESHAIQYKTFSIVGFVLVFCIVFS